MQHNMSLIELWNEFLKQIVPNLKQFVQLELVKYINTGDRVKDGVIVLVCTQLLTFVFSFLHFLCNWLVSMYIHCNESEESAMETFANSLSLSEIDKSFKFSLSMSGTYGLERGVYLYLENTNQKMHYKHTRSSKFTLLDEIHQAMAMISSSSDDKVPNTIRKFCKNMIRKSETNMISDDLTVVKSYLNTNNHREFIVIHGHSLWSNSKEELNDLLHKVLEFMYESKPKDKSTKIKIWTISKASSELDPSLTCCGEIQSHMTFDTIYFDKKQVVLEWLDKFKNGAMYPVGLSLSNKLGILLYGPPGTGKTGCIRAIANYLKRSIIMIDAIKSQVSTLTQLMNKYKNTHIIVFDEIDYLLHHALNKEKDEEDELSKCMELLKTLTDTSPLYAETIDKIKKLKSSGNEYMNIRGILQLLDGMVDDSNRIIIATTNNIDSINPLFLRPGRFDLKVELTYCSLQMFIDILKTKFSENDILLEQSNLEELVQLKITPLELINKLVESSCLVELVWKLQKQYSESHCA